MGRSSTGATSTNACKRVTISFLKKQGYLKDNNQVSGTISYSYNDEPAESIRVFTNMVGNPYLQLFYTLTDRHTGEKTDIDYKVDQTTIQIWQTIG